MPGVLFVCLGNICRSPLAEGVMRNHLQSLEKTTTVIVDSAATSNYHTGENPHSGGQKCAKRHGFNIIQHQARQVIGKDFDKFDLIVAMDKSNVDDLIEIKNRLNPKGKGSICMLSDFIPGQEGKEVPDAYYAQDQTACFEEIYYMSETAASNITNSLLSLYFPCCNKQNKA